MEKKSRISNKMYLGLLVLFLQQVHGQINNQYTGFSSCWSYGWECRDYRGGLVFNEQDKMIFEVTYNCENYTTEGRVWVWTERLPKTTKKFTVTNCKHIELHTECTRSYRETKIDEFRVINVNHLELLDTSSGYLHDNGYDHHLPPLIYLENIQLVTLPPTVLNVSKYMECTYNSEPLKKLVMKRVTIDSLEQMAGEYDVFLSGVTVRQMESNPINVTGNITIEDSRFPNSRANGMMFAGQDVVLRGNRFDTISKGYIKVKSLRFNFTENTVNAIANGGLSVKSSKVSIERNKIVRLDAGAFSDISPYYYAKEATYNLSYSFVGNEFEILAPFSLHNNWKEYEKTCTRVDLNDNKFHCTCYNLVWLNIFQRNKTLENAGFYGIFLNTTHHCGTSVNCSLSRIIQFICHNESSVSIGSQCENFREKEDIDIPTEVWGPYPSSRADTGSSNHGYGTEPSREISYRDEATTRRRVPHDPVWGYRTTEDVRYRNPGDNDGYRMGLDGNYYESVTVSTRGAFHNFPKWLVGVVAVALIGLIASVFVVWYLRRRKNQKFFQIYKYERNKDSDNLIAGGRIEVGNIEGSNNLSYE